MEGESEGLWEEVERLEAGVAEGARESECERSEESDWFSEFVFDFSGAGLQHEISFFHRPNFFSWGHG